MATNILMPALSPTMTEGNLARWLKAEGDTVKAGDVIAEIETDKATMEVEAVDEGVLGKIVVAAGTQGVAVNAVIAVLVEKGETVPNAAPAAAPAAPPPAAPAPAEKIALNPQPIPPAEKAALNPQPLPPKANGHAAGDRVFASPLARRMAQQSGLSLEGVAGSGPNGRIVKADVEAALAKPAAAPTAPAPVAAAAPAPKPAAPVAITAPHTAVPNRVGVPSGIPDYLWC